MKDKCSIEGCVRSKSECFGLCGPHAYRKRRFGDPFAGRQIGVRSQDGFWAFVRKEESCWLWTGRQTRGGYGQVGRQRAHRFAYQLECGPIPQGMLVCHHCDNPICVRPSHLFVGTIIYNNMDKHRKGRDAIGEKHGNSRLTNEQVFEIRRLGQAGVIQREIAPLFGYSRRGIGAILTGTNWKRAPRPSQRDLEADLQASIDALSGGQELPEKP